MVSNKKTVVIIDDYPLYIQVCRNILKDIESFEGRWSFKICDAKSGDEVLDLLEKMELSLRAIDLVI